MGRTSATAGSREPWGIDPVRSQRDMGVSKRTSTGSARLAHKVKSPDGTSRPRPTAGRHSGVPPDYQGLSRLFRKVLLPLGSGGGR